MRLHFGMAIIAVMVGILGFAGLKLTPIYLENYKIKRVLQDVKSRLEGQNVSPQLIRSTLDKHINIEMIYDMKGRDFLIEKSDGGYRVAARYARTAPFLANVSLTVDFDDEVEIRL